MRSHRSIRRLANSGSATRRIKHLRLIMASVLVILSAVAAVASISFVLKWGTSGTADGQFI